MCQFDGSGVNNMIEIIQNNFCQLNRQIAQQKPVQ